MLLFIILYKKINTLKTGDCCVNVYAVSNNNNNTEKKCLQENSKEIFFVFY